jgi:hypothetical protein
VCYYSLAGKVRRGEWRVVPFDSPGIMHLLRPPSEAVGRMLGSNKGKARVVPVFGDTLGRILKPKLIEIAIIDKLQHTHHGLISLDIDIFEEFGISRSFQRGAMPTACTRGGAG